MPRGDINRESYFIPGNANPNKSFVGPLSGARSGGQPAPVTPAPAPARASAPTAAVARSRPSTSVGTGSSGYIAPTVMPAPVAPSVDEFLASDSAYQQQNNAFTKAWADYQAQKNQSEGQYRTQYDMNKTDLGKARELAGQELEADYASRGLLGSGLYSKAYNDYTTEYDRKQKALDTGLSDFLANLLSASNNFKSEQDIALEKAKQSAIERRAAQYSL